MTSSGSSVVDASSAASSAASTVAAAVMNANKNGTGRVAAAESATGFESPYSAVYNSKFPMNFNPDYMTVLELEKFEDHESWRQWMWDHWHWSIYASVAYMTIVFLGQILMRNHEPFKLRGLLTFWNVFLAVFSTAGFLRSVPELVVSVVIDDGGFHKSVCFLENHNSATSLWGLLFALSKIVEFGDTAFIVLRKQPLIFLHWYHHMSVCIYCWFAHGAHDPASRWFCTMNFFVHGFMYTYYGLRSLQVKLPRGFAMTITCLQITQMIVGLIVNIHSYRVIKSGGECHRPISNIYAALALYASYFVLFAHFFYKAYMKKATKKKAQ